MLFLSKGRQLLVVIRCHWELGCGTFGPMGGRWESPETVEDTNEKLVNCGIVFAK